jgi:hypothetical protein
MSVQTRYARNGSVHLAYQVRGAGPHDIVFIPDWITHIDVIAELPELARFIERLTTFGRVIMTNMRVTIAFTVVSGTAPIQRASVFEDDATLAADFVACFDTLLLPRAVRYDEWLTTLPSSARETGTLHRL